MYSLNTGRMGPFILSRRGGRASGDTDAGTHTHTHTVPISPSSSSPTAQARHSANDSSPEAGAVAVLFGWLGAQDRTLSKYAALLHEAGDVREGLRVTAPAWDLFMRPSAVRDLAEQTLRLLQGTYPHRPVILYYLSNGGAFVHEQLLQVLERDSASATPQFSAVTIAATVFDSAPAWVSPHTGARAASEGIQSQVARRAAYWAVWLGLRAAVGGIASKDRPTAFFDVMRRDPLPCPSLYIYSSTDRVTEAGPLRELIADRRRVHPLGPNGVREWFITAPTSPHVSHYVTQPAAYRDQLSRFLRYALSVRLPRGVPRL